MSITKDVVKRLYHPLTAAIGTGDLDKVKRIPLDVDESLDKIIDSVRPFANDFFVSYLRYRHQKSRTPLMIASANGYANIVKWCLEKGSDIKHVDSVRILLPLAVLTSNINTFVFRMVIMHYQLQQWVVMWIQCSSYWTPVVRLIQLLKGIM